MQVYNLHFQSSCTRVLIEGKQIEEYQIVYIQKHPLRYGPEVISHLA
jgi:hypothetical protein